MNWKSLWITFLKTVHFSFQWHTHWNDIKITDIWHSSLHFEFCRLFIAFICDTHLESLQEAVERKCLSFHSKFSYLLLLPMHHSLSRIKMYFLFNYIINNSPSDSNISIIPHDMKILINKTEQTVQSYAASLDCPIFISFLIWQMS